MNVAEMLGQAAVLVRTHGLWKKGESPTGGFCTLSSLYHVRLESGVAEELERAAVAAVVEYLNLPSAHAVIAWNDAPERTASEVAEVLEVAGLLAGAGAQSVCVVEAATA